MFVFTLVIFCYWILDPMQSSHTVNLHVSWLFPPLSCLETRVLHTSLLIPLRISKYVCFIWSITSQFSLQEGFEMLFDILLEPQPCFCFLCPDSPTWWYILLGGFYIFPFSPSDFLSVVRKKEHHILKYGLRIPVDLWNLMTMN